MPSSFKLLGVPDPYLVVQDLYAVWALLVLQPTLYSSRLRHLTFFLNAVPPFMIFHDLCLCILCTLNCLKYIFLFFAQRIVSVHPFEYQLKWCFLPC